MSTYHKFFWECLHDYYIQQKKNFYTHLLIHSYKCFLGTTYTHIYNDMKVKYQINVELESINIIRVETGSSLGETNFEFMNAEVLYSSYFL